MSYPINLNIEEKICIVLGGGNVALRKVKGLIEGGGRVKIISESFCDEIKKLAEDEKVELIQEKYFEGCLPRGFIFIAATNDINVNKTAAIEASKKNMLVNVVNKNYLKINQFTMPSVIRRKNLMITISTEGKSPSLSKKIRLEMEKEKYFDKWLEELK